MLRFSPLRLAQILRAQRNVISPTGAGRVLSKPDNKISQNRFHFDRLHKFTSEQALFHSPLQSTLLPVQPPYKDINQLREDLRTVFRSFIPFKTLEREVKKYLASQNNVPQDENEKFRREILEKQAKRLFNRWYFDIHQRVEDLWETLKLPSERIEDNLAFSLEEEKWNFSDYTEAIYTFIDRFVKPDPEFDNPKSKGPFKPLGYKWILNSKIKERDLYTLAEFKLNQGYSPSKLQEYLEDMRQLKHWSEGREIIALRVHNDYDEDATLKTTHMWIHQRCIVISFRHRKIYLSEISQTFHQKQIEDPDTYGEPTDPKDLQMDEVDDEPIGKKDKMNDPFREPSPPIGEKLDLLEQMLKASSELNNSFKEIAKKRNSANVQKHDSDLPSEEELDRELKKLFLKYAKGPSEMEKDIDKHMTSLKRQGKLEEVKEWEVIKKWLNDKDNPFFQKPSFDISGVSWNEVPQFLLTKGLAIPQDNVNELEKFFTAKKPLPLPSLENNDPNSFSEEQLDEHIQKHGLDKIVTWDQFVSSSKEPFSKQSPLRYVFPDYPASTKPNKLFRIFRRLEHKLEKNKTRLSKEARIPRPRHRCKLFSIPSAFLEAMKRVPWPADQSPLIEDFFEHVSHKGEVVPRQRPPILGAMKEDEKFDLNFNLM